MSKEGRRSLFRGCIKHPLLIFTHSNLITKTVSVFQSLDLFVGLSRTGLEVVPQCPEALG